MNLRDGSMIFLIKEIKTLLHLSGRLVNINFINVMDKNGNLIC